MGAAEKSDNDQHRQVRETPIMARCALHWLACPVPPLQGLFLLRAPYPGRRSGYRPRCALGFPVEALQAS